LTLRDLLLGDPLTLKPFSAGVAVLKKVFADTGNSLFDL